MTRTALDTPSRRPNPLPHPSPAEVLALQAVTDYPSVSILCCTEEGATLSATALARLEHLVGTATQRVGAELGPQAAESVRESLTGLLEDVRGRPARAAVALYVSSNHASAWALPLPVHDRAVVDPTFATRDLVRALHRTPRHVVLVLTEREARLFDGAGDTLLPPFGGAFPLVDQPPARVGAREARDRRAMRGRPRTTAFLREVDRALGTYLALHPAPLVLVGSRRVLSHFTQLSVNCQRLAGRVYGSHTRTPLPTLTRLIRPILDAYLHSREAEALDLVRQRAGTDRLVHGMPAAWLAARAERPEMLAVEETLYYPARLSPDGDLITPAEDIEHPDVIDDAVDELIETVLRRGGWVALVAGGALVDHDRVALTLRNP